MDMTKPSICRYAPSDAVDSANVADARAPFGPVSGLVAAVCVSRSHEGRLPIVADSGFELRRRLTVAGAASELRLMARTDFPIIRSASDLDDRRASAPERGGSITSSVLAPTMNGVKVRDELRSRGARVTVTVRAGEPSWRMI
jgi:hypothetical protein